MTVQIQASPETIRLRRWQRWLIYGATLALFVSGAIWLLARYALRADGEFGATVHPLEPWMLRLHGLAVTAGLFLYGSLMCAHMIKAWQLRRNRISGLCAAAILAWLAASGYLLYYAANENLRPMLSVMHWGAGLMGAAALPVHVYYGRRAQRKHRRRVATPPVPGPARTAPR